MIEYIKGVVADLGPTYIVLENSGIGYFINISLPTYSVLSGKKEAQIYIHEVIREDAHTLYGFLDLQERALFRQLISVSGIGANTARMMLSSLSAYELQQAILAGEVNVLKGIKGIGVKTAQRIIVDLKDKLGKVDDASQKLFVPQGGQEKEEALAALVMLGFAKTAAQKALDKIIAKQPGLSVEELIKLALKML